MEIKQMLELVSELTQVPMEQLTGNSRVRHIQDARKMAMNLIRDTKRITYKRIGAFFGVTSASVINAINGHKMLFETINEYQKTYEKILANIDNSDGSKLLNNEKINTNEPRIEVNLESKTRD